MKNSDKITTPMTSASMTSRPPTPDDKDSKKTINPKQDPTQCMTNLNKSVDGRMEKGWEAYAMDRYCGWWM
tara:strand:- start:2245 stop:2457 length:213 start_codon:yes stop_codon:yes gene_type:complete